MWKRFLNWWNKDKIAVDNALASMDRVETRIKQLIQESESLKTQLATADQQLSEYKQKEQTNAEKYSSAEPWVEIKSASFDEVRGIQIALDWNQAFIEYLKEQGITGNSDDMIVQKWLGMLYGHLMQSMEDTVVEQSSKRRVNDFE